MVFSSNIFLCLFLPIVFTINFFLKTRFSNWFLLIASLFFYAWGEPQMVILMIISIIVNWGIGVGIQSLRWGEKSRKTLLFTGVLFNLGVLGYYKYFAFFLKAVIDISGYNSIVIPDVKLPIGISFFTFQAISYIIDTYREDNNSKQKFVNVALYISFFPQLIAGPIVKYNDISNQIDSRQITKQGVSIGVKRFIYGLAKKVLIANVLGMVADTVYSLNINGLDFKAVWIGSLAYTFQIYYDFSGYSDMAIGLGKMFGFRFNENFNYPYLSKSISEFWRRWHISLGSWFKEYVYIPLGGNKRGNRRTYVNLFIVFILTGIWHGANYTYILWGIYNGILQILERIRFKKILSKYNIFASIYCFFLVNIGWVFFRSESITYALSFIKLMFIPNNNSSTMAVWSYLDNKSIFISICAIIGLGELQFLPEKIKENWSWSIWEVVYCGVLMMLCFASIISNSYNPFIYFQF